MAEINKAINDVKLSKALDLENQALNAESDAQQEDVTSTQETLRSVREKIKASKKETSSNLKKAESIKENQGGHHDISRARKKKHGKWRIDKALMRRGKKRAYTDSPALAAQAAKDKQAAEKAKSIAASAKDRSKRSKAAAARLSGKVQGMQDQAANLRADAGSAINPSQDTGTSVNKDSKGEKDTGIKTSSNQFGTA